MSDRAPRVVDASKVRKRSDRRQLKTDLIVPGTRVKTSTGFKVSGFKNTHFETKYECMLPQSTTNVLCHSKKDKVARVVSGEVYVIQPGSEYKAVVGDEIKLSKGKEYRLATASEPVDLFIVQDVAYDRSVSVVKEVKTFTDVPEYLLGDVNREEPYYLRPYESPKARRGSKAVEQSVAMRSGVPQSPQVVSSADQRVPEAAGLDNSVNAKPTGGHFDESGAG